MSNISLSVARLIKTAGSFGEGEMTVAGCSLGEDDLKALHLLLRKFHTSLKATDCDHEPCGKKKKKKTERAKISVDDIFKKYVLYTIDILLFL